MHTGKQLVTLMDDTVSGDQMDTTCTDHLFLCTLYCTSLSIHIVFMVQCFVEIDSTGLCFVRLLKKQNQIRWLHYCNSVTRFTIIKNQPEVYGCPFCPVVSPYRVGGDESIHFSQILMSIQVPDTPYCICEACRFVTLLDLVHALHCVVYLPCAIRIFLDS